MNNDEKNCPFCGETIKAVAIKCKHCQSDLSIAAVKEIINTKITTVQDKENEEKKMFLKSGDNLSIEDPDEEKFKQTFANMKNEIYCLSTDRRVGSIYSEFAEDLLEIKKKSNNNFEISIQEKKNPNESALETVKSVVDLSTAIKIAVSYTSKNKSWKNLTEWKIQEESLFGIFYAFFEIVLKPSKAVIIFFMISVILAIGIAVFLHKNFSPSKFLKSNEVTVKKEMPEFIIGDVVKNNFFSYKVHGFQFADSVGSLLLGIDAGQGNKFLIIDVEIKNIDKESRFIDTGEVRISHNGRWLKYEQPQAILSDEFIIFDNLNPLTTIRGKVAFKVPKELNGPFYWVPPRTDGLIKLTNQRKSSIQEWQINKNVNKTTDSGFDKKIHILRKQEGEMYHTDYFATFNPNSGLVKVYCEGKICTTGEDLFFSATCTNGKLTIIKSSTTDYEYKEISLIPNLLPIISKRYCLS